MRIDKFLKVSRIIKRRTVAQDACDGGRIEVNGREAKPSKDVKPGDIVTNAKDSKLTVVDEPVDAAWIKAYGADNVAVVKKYVEPEKAESEE